MFAAALVLSGELEYFASASRKASSDPWKEASQVSSDLSAFKYIHSAVKPNCFLIGMTSFSTQAKKSSDQGSKNASDKNNKKETVASSK